MNVCLYTGVRSLKVENVLVFLFCAKFLDYMSIIIYSLICIFSFYRYSLHFKSSAIIYVQFLILYSHILTYRHICYHWFIYVP